MRSLLCIPCFEVIYVLRFIFAFPPFSKNHKLMTNLFPLFLLAFLVLPLFSGCAQQPQADTLEVLNAMLAAATPPASDVYLLPRVNDTDIPEGNVRIADAALLLAAFGSDEFEVGHAESEQIWELSPFVTEEGAMCFPTAASPCEYIVLRCISRSDTDAVAALLLQRLDALRREYQGSDVQQLVENGRVIVIEKYVLLIVSDNPQRDLSAARQAIRK
jgi:hypothetical protein